MRELLDRIQLENGSQKMRRTKFIVRVFATHGDYQASEKLPLNLCAFEWSFLPHPKSRKNFI
jgi:hypothetical protein